jgi:hypothetical protein
MKDMPRVHGRPACRSFAADVIRMPETFGNTMSYVSYTRYFDVAFVARSKSFSQPIRSSVPFFGRERWGLQVNYGLEQPLAVFLSGSRLDSSAYSVFFVNVSLLTHLRLTYELSTMTFRAGLHAKNLLRLRACKGWIRLSCDLTDRQSFGRQIPHGFYFRFSAGLPAAAPRDRRICDGTVPLRLWVNS